MSPPLPCPAPWPPGELSTLALRTWQRALEVGALLPIDTRVEIVPDGGVRFQVRVLESLNRKAAARRRQQRRAAEGDAPRDPFLPHDPHLCVSGISPSHVCLLNKFPALRHHLLVVTREFEPQRAALTEADFAALWACMREVDGLGFYNAGAVAGASQRHKHLQLVPLPLHPGEPAFPLAPLLDAGLSGPHPAQLAALPFQHLGLALHLETDESAAASLLAAYQRLCPDPSQPYNLLLTRRWMLWVPRRHEGLGRISTNALGFAGSLLVRDEAELRQVRRVGPLALLRHVGLPSVHAP